MKNPLSSTPRHLRLMATGIFSAALVVAAAGCGAGGSEPEAGSLTIAVAGTDSCAQGFIGENQGFFEDNNIEVKITVVAGIPELASAVSSGQAQLACTSPESVINAQAQDLDFLIVAPGATYSKENEATYVVVGADETDIKSVKDLAGKTIAVNSLSGSMTFLSTQAALDDAGVDLDSVKWVKVDFPSIGQSIESGQVPVGVLVSPFHDQAVGAGIGTRLVSPYASVNDGNPFPITVWFGTADYINNNSEEIDNFRNAISDITEWANDPANLDERRAILAEAIGVDPELLAQVKPIQYAPTLETDQLEAVKNLLVRFENLDESTDVNDLIATND